MRLRILVVSSVLPRADLRAGDRRLVELFEIMARTHEVHLCVLLEDQKADAHLAREHRRRIEETGVRILPFGWPSLMAVLPKTRYYDIGIFEFYTAAAECAEEFRRRQPGAKVAIDSVDVHFAREAAGAALGVVDLQKVEETRLKEVTAYRQSDAVIVVSDLDRDALEHAGQMPPLFIVPIIVPMRPRRAVPREREALFVGGFGHSPNLDGLRWFVHEAWPIVRRSVPDARLTVIGSNAPPEVTAFANIDGIEVLGYVPDTNAYLDRAMVSVAPLRFGAGMKGKVCEALASGLPVVTTTIGAQGLAAVSGEHMMLADESDAFAARLIELFGDPARCERMGLAGQQLVNAICSPEAAQREMSHMFAALVPSANATRESDAEFLGVPTAIFSMLTRLPPGLMKAVRSVKSSVTGAR